MSRAVCADCQEEGRDGCLSCGLLSEKPPPKNPPELTCYRCNRVAVRGALALGGPAAITFWNWPTVIVADQGPRAFVLCEPCVMQALDAIGIDRIKIYEAPRTLHSESDGRDMQPDNLTLRVLVQDFINQVRLARHQRGVRGTGAVGAELPGESLSYVQPSALAELVKIARQMEVAMAAETAEWSGPLSDNAERSLNDIMALQRVCEEMERARRKHNYSLEGFDDDRRLRVMVEEVGEIASAIDDVDQVQRRRDEIARREGTSALEHARECVQGARDHVIEEVVQVAACAMRWIAAETAGQ